MIFHSRLILFKYFLSGSDYHVLNVLQLFYLANKRYHYLRNYLDAVLSHSQSRFDYRTSLHSGDLGISHCQTATSVTHHRVEFMQTVNCIFKIVEFQAHSLCKICDLLVLMRNEFVERWVKETYRDRSACHSLIKSLEVFSLHWQNLGKSLFALFNGLGYYHLSNRRYSVLGKEHMLSTAKTDTLCAEAYCDFCVFRRIGISSYLQSSVFVSPLHYRLEVAAYSSLFGSYLLAVYLTC